MNWSSDAGCSPRRGVSSGTLPKAGLHFRDRQMREKGANRLKD